MCGISFILDKKRKLSEEPIRRMMASLNHRGPDSSSFYQYSSSSSQLFFAANRLKIVEKGNLSNQPFFSDDKSALIIFNGEIYNYHDLKNELLQKGITFKSQSDTEVLLYWLKVRGPGGISEINGMFSFLYYDFTKQELISARDRFGMKPLYYFNNENYLIISSEIKGIFSTGLVEKELNTWQVHHYFTFRHSSPPETFYKNIFQVEKGNYLKIINDKIQPINYYKLYSNNEKYINTDIGSFKEKIKESVLNQLHASYGVGLLLSGGIDSSLILSLAHEEGIKIPCFSIFAEENKHERKLAESLTRQKLIDHHVVNVDNNILNDFEEFIFALDQPISDSAGLLTYKICSEASNHVKVLLSGAGADELFAGYNRHAAYHYYLKNKRKLLRAKKTLWPLLKNVPGMKKSTAGSFFENIHNDQKTTFLNFVSSHFTNLRLDFSDPIPSHSGNDYFQWALKHDRNNYLPNDVLMISDVMSMQAGIEMRMPYLDNELMNMVEACEPDYLIKKGRKWILKEILKDYVHLSFLKQKKQGFGLPIGDWFRSNSNYHLWELFDNKNSFIFNFLNRDFFNDLLISHQTRKSNHEQELWSILTLAHWLKKEFE